MGPLVFTLLLEAGVPGAVTVAGGGGITVVSQTASGPGGRLPITGGAADEPQTPYEFFTGMPGQAGAGSQANLDLRLSYETKRLRLALESGAVSYTGNNTDILYLGEPVLPSANPFVSSRSQMFYSYFGAGDPTGVNRASIVSGSIGALDGSWGVTGGWFLPHGSLPFVFAPPPLPNSPPQIAPLLPEDDSGPPALQQWTERWPALPLQGVDALFHRGRIASEFFDGALPTRYFDAVYNDSARVASYRIGVSGARGQSYALQIVHAHENTLGGYSPIPGSVMWGGDEETSIGPEGPQPDSDTFGQRNTRAGISVRLPLTANVALAADFGRSWFAAQYFSKPGQATPGGYYHLGITQTSKRSVLSLDAYRFEPTYAPMILPYGNFVNNWPVAWSWPSNWLKSDYQLVANGEASVNRQGLRVRYERTGGALRYHAGYAQFAQVTPYTSVTALLPGFTDPFFTARDDAPLGYRGTQTQVAAGVEWAMPWLNASLETVEDFLHRRVPASNPEEAIDMRVPQAIFTLVHHTPDAVYAAGEGRFAIHGCYALCGTADVQLSQRVFFAGVNLRAAPRSSWLLEWRRYLTGGLPIANFPVSPAYTGTRIILEERFTLSP